jgi:hypothetical protein
MNTALRLGIMDNKENRWEKTDVSWNVFQEEDCELHPFES